jgi:hypothetical protein
MDWVKAHLIVTHYHRSKDQTIKTHVPEISPDQFLISSTLKKVKSLTNNIF